MPPRRLTPPIPFLALHLHHLPVAIAVILGSLLLYHNIGGATASTPTAVMDKESHNFWHNQHYENHKKDSYDETATDDSEEILPEWLHRIQRAATEPIKLSEQQEVKLCVKKHLGVFMFLIGLIILFGLATLGSIIYFFLVPIFLWKDVDTDKEKNESLDTKSSMQQSTIEDRPVEKATTKARSQMKDRTTKGGTAVAKTTTKGGTTKAKTMKGGGTAAAKTTKGGTTKAKTMKGGGTAVAKTTTKGGTTKAMMTKKGGGAAMAKTTKAGTTKAATAKKYARRK